MTEKNLATCEPSDDSYSYSAFFDRNPLQRIKVFISSKCDKNGPYCRLRTELAEALESFGIFSVYVWERGGASTATSKENYLMELGDSNVCVFILINGEETSEGVCNEIDYARRRGKKALIYFCSEFSQQRHPLQDELKEQNGFTYKTVERFSKIKNQVVCDLLEDILQKYRGWCNECLIFNDGSNSAEANPDQGRLSSQIHKDCYENLSGTQTLFANLLFGSCDERSPSSPLDKACVELARALYFDYTISHFNSANLIEAVTKAIPGPYADVSAKRWEGICRYFSGDIEGAISLLSCALNEARQESLDEWFVGDILIDLRNISHDLPGILDDKYQIELTDRPVSVVYPLIDRAETNMYEHLNDDEIKLSTKSMYTFTYGENSMRFLEEITEIFAIAACFGSLTHISRTIKRLKAVAFHLCSKYEDAVLRTSLLKFTIVSGRHEDGEKVLQVLTGISFDTDSSVAMGLMDFCANYKCLNDSGMAPFEAFSMTGCYLNDTDFAKAQAAIILAAENALVLKDPWEPKPRSVFGSLKANIARLSSGWVIDFCIRSLKSGRFFWIDQALRFIADAHIDYSCVTNETVLNLLEAIKDALEANKNDFNTTTLVCYALIGVSSCTEGGYDHNIDAIVNLLPKKDQTRFAGLDNDAQDDEAKRLLALKQIENLEDSNETQGVNGFYAFGADRAAAFYAYVTCMETTDYDLVRRGFVALVECVKSKTQDYGSKVHALRAIAGLLEKFSLEEIEDDGLLISVLKDRDAVLSGRQFENATASLVDTCANILMVSIGVDDSQSLMLSLVNCFKSGQYTQAIVAEMLELPCSERLINEMPDSVLTACFLFTGHLVKSGYFQLVYRGLDLLTLLLRNRKYRKAAANILASSYAGQSPRGKFTIIDSIPIIREFDVLLAKEVRNQVLRDNTITARNYLKAQERSSGF